MTLLRLSDELSIRFAADPLGLLFAGLVSFIFLFVIFYAIGYMHHEGKSGQFFLFYGLTWLFLVLLGLAANAVTMYMCFELMSVFSMPMVLHNGSRVSRDAAFKYLGYSALGASLALLGLFLCAAAGVSLEFAPGGHVLPEGNEKLLQAAFLLVFIGFGAKAGLVPLQMWLTEAHPVAPSPASAVLSGVIAKSGVFAIMRMLFWVLGSGAAAGSWVRTLLTVMALTTIFMGSMLALREKVLKKRLAYSTVSNVSYVLFGLLTLSAAGFTGAMLQVLFHALAKDVLFLAAGAIIMQTGCTHVDELRGIGKRMPVTMWCFTIAALSLIGIPPTGGFVAKWYLAMAALEGGSVLGLTGIIVIMVSALLTAFYLLPIVSDAFFPGKDFVPEKPCEIAPRMRIPLILFSALIILMGCFSGSLVKLFTALAGSLM